MIRIFYLYIVTKIIDWQRDDKAFAFEQGNDCLQNLRSFSFAQKKSWQRVQNQINKKWNQGIFSILPIAPIFNKPAEIFYVSGG
jgi:hypothetical protein